MDVTTPEGRSALAETYRGALLGDVIPFWMRHGLDREHGGYLTALDRDGTVIDTDKSVWFQGRGAWTFATLFNTVERNPEWLDAARSGIEFLRRHGASPEGKLYFTVTRDGRCGCGGTFTARRSRRWRTPPITDALEPKK